MLYPDNIEQKIDFGVIRNCLSSDCSSKLGRERVDAMKWLSREEEIRPLLHLADEMVHLLHDLSLQLPVGDISDLREAIQRIRIEGLFLDEEELFALKNTIRYAAEMQKFFHDLDEQRYPTLHSWGTLQSTNLSAIVRQIDAILDRYGRLRDTASPELGRIRHDLSHAQGSVGRAIDQILRQAQAAGILDKEATPTLREGRLVLPVPPAYKRKISGIVHDESATGKTIYIEPQQVVEANNRIRELEGEERRERTRILINITNIIRPETANILASQSFLGDVDFLRAKARLALRLKAIVPEFINAPSFDWRNARHPVLYLRFSEQEKEVVPLNIQLGDNKRILVISGPNAGGKSVCLKTVALMQYMLQCGLPIPVAETSKAGLFTSIMMDIGDEQSIENDLSTYSSHLRNMKAFVRQADNKTLFLIDEFGSGTEPLMGGAIAESVLGRLTELGAVGIVTTHYTNLKHFAEQHEGVQNGAMLYDRGQLRPLFQLSIGQAGSSFAIEIARQIGLPEELVQQAIDLIGAEHIDYDKQLQDIARDKRYWENKRQNIRQREKHLEEKIAYYENEISGLKLKKKAMMDEAKQQAADLLRESNATIERTIREIKEKKAEKEATKKAREKVESMKQKVVVENTRPKAETKDMKKQGDKITFRDLSDLKELTKPLARFTTETNTPKPRLNTTSVVDEMRRRKLSFSRELDLRGLRADEALEQVIAYIDDAIMVGAGEVTILHGTGTGALKKVVRNYLDEKKRTMIRRGTGNIVFHDGDPDRGGAGLTIVEL